MERRLAAIVAVDVVGYSRLMGEDEGETLAQLKAHRKELLDPKTAEHRGRVVKLMGDGALVEFPSVVEAVQCAVEIQRAMAERNAAIPEDRRIEFRLGINLGDVIVEGDDIYGDGVNVAARLEGLAEPGGVCVARNVYNQVRTKLDLAFEPMGEHRVKNIAEPVTAYRVDPGTPRARARKPARRFTLRLALAAGIVALVAAAAVAAWLRPWEQWAAAPASVARAALPLPDKPSIAVLPFDNLSGDPDKEYFSDGLTEDIITRLSKNQDLFVIARNSTFTFKGKAVDVRRVARDLGVKYVLEGSVQFDNDQIRVSAQLIDAVEGRHLWAESYDRPAHEFFAVQDELVETISGILLSYVRIAEKTAAFDRPTASLRAQDLVWQGVKYKHSFTREGSLRAREVLKKAIELDPTYADAYAYLGYAILIDYTFKLTGQAGPEALGQAMELFHKALALNPTLAIAYQAMGYALSYQGRVDDALAASRKSVELNPNDADSYMFLARAAAVVGNYREAVEAAEKAVRLDPLSPIYFFSNHGIALYTVGNYGTAADVYAACLIQDPKYFFCRLGAAATLVELDRVQSAREHARVIQELRPGFTLEDASSIYPFKDEAMKTRFLDDLRKAGVPEKQEPKQSS
jgi:adenylate cyclase